MLFYGYKIRFFNQEFVILFNGVAFWTVKNNLFWSKRLKKTFYVYYIGNEICFFTAAKIVFTAGNFDGQENSLFFTDLLFVVYIMNMTYIKMTITKVYDSVSADPTHEPSLWRHKNARSDKAKKIKVLWKQSFKTDKKYCCIKENWQKD